MMCGSKRMRQPVEISPGAFAILLVTRTQGAMTIRAFSQGQNGRTLYDMSVELKPVTGRTMRK